MIITFAEVHPKAFAVIAAFEDVHWCEFNGLNCLMMNEALVHMVDNYKPNIEYLIERHPVDLDYIMPTINALIEREHRTMT
jgi:hypothetical protein